MANQLGLCDHHVCNAVSFMLTLLVKSWTRHSANVAAAVMMITGLWLNALMLALANERVPIQDKVLPDILFDMLPYNFNWFTFSEVFIGLQNICFIILLIFHSEREIILRRFMFIVGIIYLMRTITFTSTVLPCPFKLTTCQPKLSNNLTSTQFVRHVFKRSFEYSFTTFGFVSRATHTLCGDYIYSGHTAIIITVYLFINTYFFMDKKRCKPFLVIIEFVHFSFCIAAVICVLISRQHYTVDVILSYYITTQLFWSYHSLCLEKYMFQELRQRYEDDQSSYFANSEDGTKESSGQTLMIREDQNFISQVWWWSIFIYLEIIKRPPDHENSDASADKAQAGKICICCLSCRFSRSNDKNRVQQSKRSIEQA